MFAPYTLTPLDHVVPWMLFNSSFSFCLIGKDRFQVMQRVEGGIAQLNSKFPFLTGMVVTSAQPDKRLTMFIVRPASATELEEYPMLVTQQHPKGTPLTMKGRLNPTLVPVPMLHLASNPSPVLRLKANTVGDKLILVWSCDHRALDGSSFLVMYHQFAAFCRDPSTPGPLITVSDVQDRTRQDTKDIASTLKPQDLPWPSFPPPISETRGEARESTDPGRFPISSYYVLDPQKITMLRDAYNLAMSSLPNQRRKSLIDKDLPPSLVVSALVGLCNNRARLQAFPNDEGHSSDLCIAVNIRKAAHIPRSYIGNCLLPAESACSDTVVSPPEVLHNIHMPGPLDALEPEDVWRICNIGQTLQQECEGLSKQRVQSVIATRSRKLDWSLFQPRYGVNLFVSDVKAASPYVNFGPLGDLQSFDMYTDTVPGICFILPDPPVSEPSWRPRLILEGDVMECLSSDSLFRWASTPSPDSSTRAKL